MGFQAGFDDGVAATCIRQYRRRFFGAGDAALLRSARKVSVVDSRASEDGLKRARALAYEMARHEIVVVSGLAEGIDTAAQRGALYAGGRTIAVIGTPLDHAYPTQNAELRALIAREHLVVSQFAPGTTVGPITSRSAIDWWHC